ncbi:MAG: hypothetical protein O3A00_15770 [Planctomycetota bacterium]|nr:hypothetical protein [Planctomycetota bacterium]
MTNQLGIRVRAGRIVCPASGWDGPGSVSIRGDRIQSIALDGHRPQVANDDVGHSPSVDEPTYDFPDGILLPGLIDLHAHPANAGSVFGVNPDTWIMSRGTTTVMSQGDAGADNVDDYVASTIRASRTRILLAINLSRIGESTAAGCFENLADADVEACVRAVERHREFIPAIAVNVSHNACGRTDPREILRRGLSAANQTGLPILFGMRRPEDWPLADQLEQLRPGDIVTYCFRQQPHCIVDRGDVLPCLRDAQDRGILFDVGHGTASFSFSVAETAIRGGFLPNTISTDLQLRHVNQEPTHDLAGVVSKLIAAGMTEAAAFAAVTLTPARILQLGEVGRLVPGGLADLVVLQRQDRQPLGDACGESRTAARYVSQLVVRNGEAIAET